MKERRARMRPAVVDGLVVAAVALVGLFGLVGPVMLAGAPPQRVSGTALAVVAAQAGVLWWRRRRPLGAFAVTVLAVLVAQALGDENAASYFGPHVGAYSVAVYGGRRAAFAGLAGLGAGAVADFAIVAAVDASAPYGPVLGWPNGVLIALACVIGRYVAVRRAYLDTLVAYTRRLESDRDEQARRAVAEERRRIARELHDQVAHHLGVVSLQTGAARRWLGRDRDRAATALESAELASRAALETMPVILQALRADAAPETAPTPTLNDVAALVDAVTAAGLAVDLHVDGERRVLHPAVELTAYRIVQEALTNVAKHAGPARATVRLGFGADRLDVEVKDDGRGLAAPAADGAGLGLIGMRERVELLDGSLATGPRPGGGFCVHAVLPANAGAGVA